MVDSLALAGRADEARTVLESWWQSQRVRSSRRDRQRGLWLRAVLTVDPRMAGLDFQRLVLEYPGGLHSDEAMLRLGLISAAAEDLSACSRVFQDAGDGLSEESAAPSGGGMALRARVGG